MKPRAEPGTYPNIPETAKYVNPKSYFYTKFTPFQIHDDFRHSPRKVLSPKKSRDDLNEHTPEATRKLYSTGFVFRNTSSPVACGQRLDRSHQR